MTDPNITAIRQSMRSALRRRWWAKMCRLVWTWGIR